MVTETHCTYCAGIRGSEKLAVTGARPQARLYLRAPEYSMICWIGGGGLLSRICCCVLDVVLYSSNFACCLSPITVPRTKLVGYGILRTKTKRGLGWRGGRGKSRAGYLGWGIGGLTDMGLGKG